MADKYPFDLGSYHRSVTCANESAQSWFDRGMMWAFGFHHEEAIACFERAAQSDPSCAMAHWGVAFSHGPNYNFHYINGYYAVSQQETGFPSMKLAFEAMQRAAALTAIVTPVEKDLIEALQLLFTWPVSSYASELGLAHANAMRAVHGKYPADADVSFVFANSLMVLHPWKLWDLKTGEPAVVVPEVRSVLEDALSGSPDHGGLCHLFVHLMEMSPAPGDALTVCARLRDLSPDNPHLCHMPSHIDVLVGHYPAAILANTKAIAADRKLVANKALGAGFFVGYAAHDYHMLIFAAMYAGQYQVARDTAVAMVADHVSPEVLSSLPAVVVNGLEAFVPTLLHVYRAAT